MTWIILSFLTAIAVSTSDAWQKKFFSHLNTYEMTAYPIFYSLPLLAFSILFIEIPQIHPHFYGWFVFGIPFNAICLLLHMKAIKVSPLSVTIPFLSFTPTFMIFTGFVVLGEIPNEWGQLGIIMTCIGGYILNIEPQKWFLFAPFKAIFKETGSWIMLLLSFFYSILAVIGKLAILYSSPMFFSVSFFFGLNISLIIFLLITQRIQFTHLLKHPIKGSIAGLLFYVHIVCHGLAISLTKAAYMISVKRLSTIISVIYGGLWFNEKNLFIRLSGASIMLGGAVVIMLKGR